MKTQDMNPHPSVNATLGLILTLMLQGSNVRAQSDTTLQIGQTKATPVIQLETYYRVLDILFSREEAGSRGSLWVFVLRFMPTSRPESEVIIRRDVDRKLGLEIVEYTSQQGSIYDQLNEALARGSKEDAVQMAKSIRVVRQKVSVAEAKVKHWYATFFDSLVDTAKVLRHRLEKADETGTESFVLHGAVYDLWYEQGLNRMSYSFYDLERDANSRAGFKLVQWMDTVRRDVDRLKQ